MWGKTLDDNFSMRRLSHTTGSHNSRSNMRIAPERRTPRRGCSGVHASSGARFEESYRKIAERLPLNGWNEPKADILGMVQGWLSDENNGRWRVIVDNADSARVMFEPRRGAERSMPIRGSRENSGDGRWRDTENLWVEHPNSLACMDTLLIIWESQGMAENAREKCSA